MAESDKTPSPRELLLTAGIQEIQENGVETFSMRKVAQRCGVCASAPYKHFRDKQAFILEIVRYVRQQWQLRQAAVMAAGETDLRQLLTRISVEYVRFLVENPQFCAIILLRNAQLSDEQRRLKAQISPASSRLVAEYCRSVGMPKEVEVRKTFVVRSLIYGAALMLDNGQLPYRESTMEMVSQCILREFDTP